jgi:hypothetical protein
MGRNVAVPTTTGGVLRTIEWHRDVEVRVRTETGMPLTAGERAGVLGLLQYCDRGDVRSPTERVERNGTFVVEYDCAWLQGAQ